MDNKDMDQLINEVYDSLERNNFGTLDKPEARLYDRPLVGVAKGDDPYYAFLKQHIGPFHWSPEDAFRLKYSGMIQRDQLRVVSIVFPQTAETKLAQSKEIRCPAREWIVSRGEWEPLMKEFSGKLTEKLEQLGIRCVSIDLLNEFSTEKSEKLGIASKWSHRHSAYLAGLGTFSLSEGLITEKGKAVRITSLIVEAPLEPTKMPYSAYNEWCLYYRDGSCGVCMKRCPADSITAEGHDKDACDAYEEYFASNFWPDDINRGSYILGCGLCQAGVPCQDKRP
jgi:epoxyqueuosine reductase QueG